ncbi:hypothetical protein SAMN05428949_5101 [Chitinophaga sp. YR627]|uniref:hypothetical protein n=1 Tax=Chitinophaga sp. YR627 TaxID=1881041 RepID=UPI0008E5B3C5|nr:hypothetical protein [Chitinophaga sp. YR627]SFO43262.1 hypothetical protein SAMN05428949_5101 [Chitinophaga sp. YR627]
MRIPLTFIFLATIAMTGCSKKTTSGATDDCIKYGKAPVSQIDKASASGNNTTTVYFPVNSGCGQFSKFIEKKSGNTITIDVEAVYKGCMCTMDIPTRKASYQLKEKAAGTYYLQFVSGENTFITDTVIVK